MEILVGVQLDDWRFSLSVFLDAGIRRAWRTPRHRRSADHVPRQGRRTHISRLPLSGAFSAEVPAAVFARSCRRKRACPGRAVRLSRATAEFDLRFPPGCLGKKPDDFLAIRQVWERKRRWKGHGDGGVSAELETSESRSSETILLPGQVDRVFTQLCTILEKNDGVCGWRVEGGGKGKPASILSDTGGSARARVRPWPRSIMPAKSETSVSNLA